MISGSILILGAAVLASAYWFGQVWHRPTLAGAPEALCLMVAAAILALTGGAVVAIGLFTDKEKIR